MTDLHKLKVAFNDGTELEICNVEDSYDNSRGFLRVETAEAEWILFYDNMKYLIWSPQRLNGSARKNE